MQHQESSDRGRPSSMNAAGARRAAMRVVQDEGAIVLVYELEPASLTGDPPSLVFECTGTRRELRDYPNEWRRMSDAQLVALLHAIHDD